MAKGFARLKEATFLIVGFVAFAVLFALNFGRENRICRNMFSIGDHVQHIANGQLYTVADATCPTITVTGKSGLQHRAAQEDFRQ